MATDQGTVHSGPVSVDSVCSARAAGCLPGQCFAHPLPASGDTFVIMVFCWTRLGGKEGKMDKHTTATGKAAEAYVWMRLLEHGMIPCIPLVDCEGFDALVKTPNGGCARVQVKSRGEPLPGGYGNQIKALWWEKDKRSLAFDYLAIVARWEGKEGYVAWMVPTKEVENELTKSGDLTLGKHRLEVDWNKYRECWDLSRSSSC